MPRALEQDMWQEVWKTWQPLNRPEPGARAGLFIVEGQWPYYNVINAPNYLPRQ
jgi:hypothetical protein